MYIHLSGFFFFVLRDKEWVNLCYKSEFKGLESFMSLLLSKLYDDWQVFFLIKYCFEK